MPASAEHRERVLRHQETQETSEYATHKEVSRDEALKLIRKAPTVRACCKLSKDHRSAAQFKLNKQEALYRLGHYSPETRVQVMVVWDGEVVIGW